ncbi:MAG TPA: DinB family protein [Vicinamibacterales bacterium]|nr:DinB family protein [Vicinamibacterales bacterium]
MNRPDRGEAADYYFRYIDKVPDGDIVGILEEQLPAALTLLRGISEEWSLHRYAPDKWSIREVMGHINDCERIFACRALWFARGLQSPLPSCDQDVAARHAGADARSWRSLVDEFDAVRASTLALFQHLPADAWLRRGVASGYEFTVRALAFIIAGHVTHHMEILRERYLRT